MELNTLRNFLTVAREENFTRAARQLHLSQPALSRQIAALEQELGSQLFVRSSHTIHLTEAGLLLKRRASELTALEEKILQEFQTGEELSGTISIGAGELLGMDLLAEAMAAFQKLHPNVRFSVYSGNADTIKERIDNGLLDVGLLSAPVEIGRFDFLKCNVDETWCVMIPETHPLADRGFLEPADLVHEPLIMTDRELVKEMVVTWLGTTPEKLHITSSINLAYNGAALAKAGMGLLVTLDLHYKFDGLRSIPLRPALTSQSVLVWKKTGAFSPLLSAFLAHCRDMFEMHESK